MPNQLETALPRMRTVASDLESARGDLAGKLRRWAEVIESGDRLGMFEVAHLLEGAVDETSRLAESWSYVFDRPH